MHRNHLLSRTSMFLMMVITAIACLFSCSDEKDAIKSSEKLITKFTINSVDGAIDQTAKAITLSLPYGANIEALTPVIVVSDKATVSPKSDVVQDFTNPVNYTVTAEDGSTQIYSAKVTVEKANETEIISFTIEGLTPKIVATIDKASKTISAKVPFGTDLTALVPTIVVSDGATIAPASGVAQDFSNPVFYTVTAENTTGQSRYTATITTESFATAITGVSSTTLKAGEEFTISGNFANEGNKVELNDIELNIKSQNANTIVAVAPASIDEGIYSLSITSNNVKVTYSEKITITIPNPVITSVNPLSSVVGQSITISITGQNFAREGNSVILTKESTETAIPNFITNNETTISFSLPATLAEGEYDITVHTGKKTVTYDSKFIVVDPNKPRLISLSKLEIIQGIEDLVINGENLGASATLYFEKENAGGSAHIGVSPVDGTTVTYTATGFQNNFFTPGKYLVWLEINNVKTNALMFTLIENSNPAPTIISVSDWNPCMGDNVTITGTNFGEDATVRVNMDFGLSTEPEIVSRSATSIVFSTEKINYMFEFVAIEVISGGQVGQKTGVFQTKDCQ